MTSINRNMTFKYFSMTSIDRNVTFKYLMISIDRNVA